jgi:hypothetical protein
LSRGEVWIAGVLLDIGDEWNERGCNCSTHFAQLGALFANNCHKCDSGLSSQQKCAKPVRISKIWVFHGGGYEECRLLGCDAVWLLQESTFRRNISSSSDGKNQPARNSVSSNSNISPPGHLWNHVRHPDREARLPFSLLRPTYYYWLLKN